MSFEVKDKNGNDLEVGNIVSFEEMQGEIVAIIRGLRGMMLQVQTVEKLGFIYPAKVELVS